MSSRSVGKIFRKIQKRCFSLEKENKNHRKIRNIGIIAHVDAGKTTVTERLLYLTGSINVAGSVDSGNTVTDFLDIERERGITVQSAAVNLDWMDHRINLIDTPGHVDFKVEVERCVRVLDGIVCIIDGSAGVQPQTLTVWKQSSKFNLPSIFFINKLDKKEANFSNSIDSIEQKLGIKSIRTSIPFEDQNGKLIGIIDVLNGKFLKMENGEEDWEEIEKNSRKFDIQMEAKNEMCYSISDQDPDFMDMFLDQFNGDHSKIDNQKIIEALRNLTISNKIATVSCGSAMKSKNCVKPVLDSVINYFPSPEMRNIEFQQVFGDDLSGLVFKITHDKRRGQLSYVRVYTGKIINNSTIFNSSQLINEGPIKVFKPYADELKPTEFVDHGNIAVISGLVNTVTGDTVLLNAAAGEKAFEKSDKSKEIERKQSSEGKSVVFSGIDAPEAVYFCCIESPSSKKQHEFNKALDELTREDPSMKIRFDRDTGQTILETQGELHLETIKDRLRRNYGLDVFIGQLQVAYREMLTNDITHSCKVENIGGEKKRSEFVSISFKIEPTNQYFPFKKIEIDLPQTARPVRLDWIKAINEGCSNALQNGPIASYPIHAVKITMTELVVSGGKINPALLSACAQKCVAEALERTGVVLTEPIMDVEINVRSNEPTQPILNELMKRRAQITFSDRVDDHTIRILVNLPLAEMENLSKVVRTLTSGFGEMNVQISGYQEVPDFEKSMILKRRIGEN